MSPKSDLTDRDKDTFVISHLTNQFRTQHNNIHSNYPLPNYKVMSGDHNDDNAFERLEAVGERTSDFATTVTELLQFIPTAVNNLRTQIKSLKDTITQKDAAIAAKDTELALKDDELVLQQNAIGDLEAEVKHLNADLIEARKKINNAQSATCYQKRKTLDEIENKVEAKRVCITQNKLIGKIVSMIATYQTNNTEALLPSTNTPISDSESDNNDANPIYKLHTFVKDIAYPHYPKSTRRAFSLSRSVTNHDIEADNLLHKINVCGSAFNALLRRKQYTSARFDKSTAIVGVLFGIFAEYWITLQWSYCCKLLQNKKDPYCFIRVECIFEVWVHCFLEHFYDLETHQAKRLRCGETIPAFTDDEMDECKFLKLEHGKRYDKNLAHHFGDEEFTPLEYEEDLKW